MNVLLIEGACISTVDMVEFTEEVAVDMCGESMEVILTNRSVNFTDGAEDVTTTHENNQIIITVFDFDGEATFFIKQQDEGDIHIKL